MFTVHLLVLSALAVQGGETETVTREGLEPAAHGAPTGRVGSSPIVPPKGPPFLCMTSITDQATAGCLTASSAPVEGTLLPYPGVDNVFQSPQFVGGGFQNQAMGPYTSIAAGRNNSALHVYASIGGGAYNVAKGRASTIAGGSNNDASGIEATVAGGANNQASGEGSTVGGGQLNTASFGGATVGGGKLNVASGYRSTVGGGSNNSATGDMTTAAGGLGNMVTGRFGAVPGGIGNLAEGEGSLAAGRGAQALHDGSFVWGDGSGGQKSSSGPDTFNVYASGGTTFFTNATATAGVTLAAGSGSWSMLSDRNAKENVEPVDPRGVLERVCSLPIATWNYGAQDDSVRHMGPMAQDFRQAFGLGVSAERIDAVDIDGVALAAIQGLQVALEENLAQRDEEILRLRRRQVVLEEEIARLSRRLPESPEPSTLEAP